MHYVLLLAFSLLFSVHSTAQDTSTFILEDADYRVTYVDDSLQVFWRGAPAGDKLQRFDEHRALLSDERGQARLLLYPGKPFRYYDRAYADTIWFDYALAAMIEEQARPNPSTPETSLTKTGYSDPDEPLEVRFANGLVVRIEQGYASAKLAGDELPVQGRDGRYRVITSDFEAGVAVTASGKLYKYLRTE